MARANNRDRGLVQYPDGQWGVACVLRGQRHSRKCGTKSEARAYYEWCRSESLASKRGDYTPVRERLSIPTVDQVLESYIARCETRLSPSSLPGYRANRKLLGAVFGNLSLAALTPQMVEHFVAEQLDYLKPASVNRQLAFFRAAVRWAICNLPEGTLRDPLARVHQLPENNQRDVFLTPEQEERLRENLPPWAYRLLRIAVLTGIRKSNLFDMRRDWIDWERALLRLPQTKDGKRHFLPLSEAAIGVLREQCATHNHDYVFPSPKGARLHPSNFFNRTWAPAREAAGLAHLHWHDLRHTTAQRMLESGAGLYTVKRALTHKNPKTTDRYAHLSDDHLRGAFDAMTRK